MLSKRLSIIYSFIDEGSSVVDVGCDHGYLLIELAKNNKSTNLLGVENKLGPFSTLNKNIKLNKLDGKINTSLSDGISNVDSSFDTLVIAGMGSDNIVGIIERNKDVLETWLEKHGVKYDELIFGKPLGDWYIDDKGMSVKDFLKADFYELKGGSNSSIRRELNKVIKTAKNSQSQYAWYKYVNNYQFFMYKIIRNYSHTQAIKTK